MWGDRKRIKALEDALAEAQAERDHLEDRLGEVALACAALQASTQAAVDVIVESVRRNAEAGKLICDAVEGLARDTMGLRYRVADIEKRTTVH